MVPLQETPPPGWPHTEAAKHHTSLHAAPPPEGRPVAPASASKRRGGCCVLTLILLVVATAGLVLGIAALSGALGSDEFEDATQVFLDAHPGWQVESAEPLDQADGPVRLVTWDYDRSVGRLAIMEPDSLSDSGWSEVPLIAAMPDDAAAEEAFLDEFANVFSSATWAYAVSVEASDIVSDPQTWRVLYRVWDDGTETWDTERETWATRDRGTAQWTVGAPGSIQDAEQGTATP